MPSAILSALLLTPFCKLPKFEKLCKYMCGVRFEIAMTVTVKIYVFRYVAFENI
jgi:hypothetical protein